MTRAARRTGFVWHERYAWHDIGTVTAHLPSGGYLQPGVPGEHPEAKRRLRNLLDVSGLLDQLIELRPAPATDAQLLRVHDAAYLVALREMSAAGGGDAGEMALFGRDSHAIARLAAGGCIAAVEAVVGGEVDNAYALVRPPGHHAEAARGRGFCLLANVAVAVRHAIDELGVRRVAIVDWDVHHGNGNQAAFYDDPSVLTVSIHQDRSYPQDSGALGEIGEGPGRGFNLNAPLPAGSGTGAYLATMRQVVAPLLVHFEPELIVVGCGLDAGALDPYGRMMVHSDGFRAMARVIVDTAHALCDGRVVACHEGGYSTAYAPFCGLAVIEELAGLRTDVVDPFLDELAGVAGQDLQPHQREQIARIARVAARSGHRTRARTPT